MKKDSDTLIDLRDRAAIRRRRPLLIAHRGGVITPDSPENSLAAIRRAAADGYDMVELDVVFARDNEPVLFHGAGAQRTLRGTSGGESPVAAHTSQELAAIFYDGSDERIAMLDDALALCRSLDLGVMLDIKHAAGEELSQSGLARVGALLIARDVTASTSCITPYPQVIELLPDDVLFPVSDDDVEQLAAGKWPDVRRKFWFGIPKHLPEPLIGPLQDAGALVIPAINRFRYPKADHENAALADIERLLGAGVDGFQIDSIYRNAFSAPSG